MKDYKFMKKESLSYAVLLYLYQNGPQAEEQILEKFQGLNKNAFNGIKKRHRLVVNAGWAYGLPEDTIEWFDIENMPELEEKAATPKVEYIGEIVPSRKAAPFKAMDLQAYGASLKANRNLRDVSFMTASVPAGLGWIEH